MPNFTHPSSTPMKVYSRRARRRAKMYLWVAQAVLAGIFIMAGAIKLLLPQERLAPKNPWVSQVPDWLPSVIGLAELAGGFGLILPSVLRFKPRLSVYAAFSLAFVMLLAIAFHAYRLEFAAIPVNVFLLAGTVYVGWSRLRKYPIDPKTYTNPFADPLKQ
jgi:putative oxidoreductase